MAFDLSTAPQLPVQDVERRPHLLVKRVQLGLASAIYDLFRLPSGVVLLDGWIQGDTGGDGVQTVNIDVSNDADVQQAVVLVGTANNGTTGTIDRGALTQFQTTAKDWKARANVVASGGPTTGALVRIGLWMYRPDY